MLYVLSMVYAATVRFEKARGTYKNNRYVVGRLGGSDIFAELAPQGTRGCETSQGLQAADLICELTSCRLAYAPVAGLGCNGNNSESMF